MNTYEVMIVDDSPFTVSILREILEKHGHSVVGSAGTLEDVKALASQTFPELVTMDMTLPGTDGLECTRAIHEINPMIKVIAISSMKDDDIVSEAIRHNISAYIQKPINEAELIDAINKTMGSDDLFDVVEAEFFNVFKVAFCDGMFRITKTNIVYKEYDPDVPPVAKDITCVIDIIGKFEGRMQFSMSKSTAAGLAVSVLKREPNDPAELRNLLMELVNIVSGNAISVLNATITKRNRSYNLRLAPPSIYEGQDVLELLPERHPQVAIAESVFGDIEFSVGFTREE